SSTPSWSSTNTRPTSALSARPRSCAATSDEGILATMVQHGSVFQRRKGPGRPWTARWRENGEHKSKGGFPDEEAAWRFLRERLYELDTGIAIAPSDITVAQYVRMFIERKRDITQNTRKVYLLRLRMQIEPHIGDVKIQNLEPLAIDLWISKLVNAGL